MFVCRCVFVKSGLNCERNVIMPERQQNLKKEPEFTYETWLLKVHMGLRERNVPQLTHNQDPVVIIMNRGDEPQGAWEYGDTPAEYVEHLRSEYELYGPDGE